MSTYLEHCMDPLDPEYQPPRPVSGPQTIGVYPSEWLARRAYADLARGDLHPFYVVAQTERGWEVIHTGRET